jgi:hypothetical protein
LKDTAAAATAAAASAAAAVLCIHRRRSRFYTVFARSGNDTARTPNSTSWRKHERRGNRGVAAAHSSNEHW